MSPPAAAKTRTVGKGESYRETHVSSHVGKRHLENTNARQYLIRWHDSTLAKNSASIRPFRAGKAHATGAHLSR